MIINKLGIFLPFESILFMFSMEQNLQFKNWQGHYWNRPLSYSVA